MSKRQSPANPTIVRAEHGAKSGWFATLRASAQDSRLSFLARGILWYLLSKPDDWKIMVEDLQREGKTGRDKVKKALIELADANYLKRPVRYKDSHGKWAWTAYVLFETPLTENQSMEPSTENQLLENRQTENQSLENHPMDSQSILHKTEDKTQKQKTEDKKETTTQAVGVETAFNSGQVFELFEKEIGAIKSDILRDDLSDLIAEFGEAKVTEAITIAVRANKQSMNYMHGIFKKWRAEQPEPEPSNGNNPGAKYLQSKFADYYNQGPYTPEVNHDHSAGLNGHPADIGADAVARDPLVSSEPGAGEEDRGSPLQGDPALPERQGRSTPLLPSGHARSGLEADRAAQ